MSARTAAEATAGAAIDPARFRRVLGHFCTGVTVVTGMGPDGPVGFACQSFAALSLEPPLVLFCPGKNSRAWPVIEASGAFAVNVLCDSQREISNVFGSRGVDKFASVDWTPACSGAPLISGSLTWIDCAVDAVHAAGDHYIVVGRVLTLGDTGTDQPLLFYHGSYTSTAPEHTQLARERLDAFPIWPCGDDWL